MVVVLIGGSLTVLLVLDEQALIADFHTHTPCLP